MNRNPNTTAGVWIAIGIAIGAGLGAALGDMTIGIGAGIALGMGAALFYQGRSSGSDADDPPDDGGQDR